MLNPGRFAPSLALVAVLACVSNAQEAGQAGRPARTNRLAKESSPYLLQHAHNPVDWYPWGQEAFDRAKKEQKPLFLSIGYSTCYWCHVMERESFEDEAIANYLNQHFVCVKVDREERPDVDQVYMAAVQAFQGHGGWPMTLFCFPDGRPFYGGTYYPPADGAAGEGLRNLAQRVVAAWRDHRSDLERDADSVTALIKRNTATADLVPRAPLTPKTADDAVAELRSTFDPEFGGFGFDPDTLKRPKFPEPTNLLFLLRQHERGGRAPSVLARPGSTVTPLRMVELSLDHLQRGGIRDHLDGGYHRYSTDRAWAVPHFEKMLYDNAQLASTFLRAYEITGNPRYRDEGRSILDFVARRLTSPEGAFFSAIDAEVNGEEGASYVWTRAEVDKVLGREADAALFRQAYGLDTEPNFEGERYVLLVPRPMSELAKDLGLNEPTLIARLEPLRAKLLAARDRRKQPLRDDKIITAWNGLMIAAYADAARILNDDPSRAIAEKAADFLWSKLRDDKGRLARCYRQGEARLAASLEDYSATLWAFVQLYRVTKDEKWFTRANDLAAVMIDDFQDAEKGGFFYNAEAQNTLIARPKDFSDGATPGANALGVLSLLELDRLSGRKQHFVVAERALLAFSGTMGRAPAASPTFVLALQQYFDAGGKTDAAAADPLGLGTNQKLVTATLDWDASQSVTPGSEHQATLRVKIAPNWHIYANPPGVPNLKPTTVEPVESSVIQGLKAEYPDVAARRLASVTDPVKVYEDSIEIALRLTIADDAPAGKTRERLRLSYQPCDDKVCLAPAYIDIPIEINIKSR